MAKFKVIRAYLDRSPRGYFIYSRILPVAYLTGANLVRFRCLVSVKSQLLVRFPSLSCITGGHTIHQQSA